MTNQVKEKAARQVGQSVKRKEDLRLLTGKGQYVADIRIANTLEAAFLRSTHAHAGILSIDISKAESLEGVTAIYTAEMLDGELKPLPQMAAHCYLPDAVIEQISPVIKDNGEEILAKGKVTYVGQPIAVVVAESRYVAEDALALIEVKYEPLKVLVDPVESLEEDAPVIQPHMDNNLQSHFHLSVGNYDQVEKEADHQLNVKLKTPRVGSNPIETRGVVAQYDVRTDFLQIYSSTQLPFEVRSYISKCLGIVEQNIRVTAPDVGGGFGPKGAAYPEEIMMAYLAKRLNQPVRWIEDRLEHMSASRHSRDQLHEVEVSFLNDGTITGLKDYFILDSGAVNYFALTCAYNSAAHLRGAFKIKNYDLTAHIVLTNKTPNVPFRGAGRPEAVFVMDRVIDKVARFLNMDPVDVMLKNIIQAEEMPYSQDMLYKDGAELVYDSGNYPEGLQMALDLANYKGIREKQKKAREQGKYIGVGISSNVEGTGAGPFESASIRIDSTGQVLVSTGSASQGQGHETVFAQVCADVLKVGTDRISVKVGDTGIVPYGAGTYASRSAVNAGSAVNGAAKKLLDKMFATAAVVLDVPKDLLAVGEGCVYSTADEVKSLTFSEVASAMAPGPRCKVPEGMEQGASADYYFVPPTVTYASAFHIVVVEVDINSCFVDLQNYYVIHESGQVINPMIVEGQVQGGIAQGIGAALYEEVVYSETGQLLTGTYMDYLIPTAMEIPTVVQGEQEYLSTRNPLGIKGIGEGGAISPPAAIANAVVDALSPFNIEVDDLPITPTKLHNLIEASGN